VHVIDRWPAQSELVTIAREVEGIGGGAANVLLALEAFGVDVPLYAMGLIGSDGHGETCRAALAGGRADLRWLAATDRARTAHTHVMTIPGDSRTFFYHPGACDLLDEGDLPVEAAARMGAGLFYLGYPNLLAALDRLGPGGDTAAARVLRRARAAGMITCVDLVSKAGPEFAAVVAALLPATDYLFCNEVEARLATGLAIEGPGDRVGIARAAAALRAGGVRGAVVVHTPELALWSGQDLVWQDPAPAADIVNPLGAGDAFCAGVIWGIHQGWAPQAALHLGHRAAAACLKGETATGTIPPLKVLLAV
jgi:sugar/nucleoside kinase (ribokinase family)